MDFKEVFVKIFDQNREIVLCAVGTAAVALLGLGLVYKYTSPEKKLTRVGVVTQLLVHPMKSGKAVSVETAECLRMGVKYGELRDRWVIVESMHFCFSVTQFILTQMNQYTIIN